MNPMTEAKAKVTKLVHELFRRCEAGVFGILYPEGEVVLPVKPKASLIVCMGLASRIQQDTYANLTAATDESQSKDLVQQIVKSYAPITDTEDLSFVTTAAILAEFYRTEFQWVVGLRRKRKIGTDIYWDGTLWNGTALACMGLAAALQHQIAEQTAKELDSTMGDSSPASLEPRTGVLVANLLHQPKLDPLLAGGIFAHLAFEANRLRERKFGSGSSLQEFLDGAPPDPEEQP